MVFSLRYLIIVGAITLFLVGFAIVRATAGDNISGWAWSSNIGWISFNDTNPRSGGGGYGVTADGNGNLSGYAWSPNIGWISFNAPDTLGCPGTPGNTTCAPKLNFSTNEVSGWARACAGSIYGDCTGPGRTDGWDGWISLRGTSPNYGAVTTATTPYYWSGWAWGGDVVGWISFSGPPSGGIAPSGSGGGYGVVGPTLGPPGAPAGPPPFVVAVTAAPNPVEIDKPVTWSALVSGSIPPYTYKWSGTDGLGGTGASVIKIYTTLGTKVGTVTVTDSTGAIKTESLEINVIPKRRIGGIREIQPE